MDNAEYARMDAVEARMWWFRALHARLASAVSNTAGRLLDAGCGTGGFLAGLPARPAQHFGLEYDLTAAQRAASKSTAIIATGSINALPYADASFDVVVCADVLCHAAVEPALALLECRRVLTPGGRLVLNMPAYAWLASAHDRRVHNARRVTATELRHWLEQAGFAVHRLTYWNSLLLPLMIVQRKLLARGTAESDVAAFPPWLDAIFFAITRLEAVLPAFPAGGSVLAVAINPIDPKAAEPRA